MKKNSVNEFLSEYFCKSFNSIKSYWLTDKILINRELIESKYRVWKYDNKTISYNYEVWSINLSERKVITYKTYWFISSLAYYQIY
jgi:hypothetical protein